MSTISPSVSDTPDFAAAISTEFSEAEIQDLLDYFKKMNESTMSKQNSTSTDEKNESGNTISENKKDESGNTISDDTATKLADKIGEWINSLCSNISWTFQEEVGQSKDNVKCSIDIETHNRYEPLSENQLPYQTVNRKKRSRTPSLLKKYKH